MWMVVSRGQEAACFAEGEQRGVILCEFDHQGEERIYTIAELGRQYILPCSWGWDVCVCV